MVKLFDAIDQAYQKRKENLTPEIDHLKSQQKWSLDRDYHDLKDQIEKNKMQSTPLKGEKILILWSKKRKMPFRIPLLWRR